MTPQTVHWIAQDIRNFRGLLTAKQTWAQSLEKSETRDEIFRYINWWRNRLKEAEHQLARS